MPVTVNKALKRAYYTVACPSAIIFFAFLMAGFALGDKYKSVEGIMIFGGLALAAIFTILYWGFTITKWKIWAFENVDNIHELEQKAIDNFLIPNDDAFWHSVIIETAKDKQKLAALQSRFNQKDIYEDDLRVPSETVIYFSRTITLRIMLAMLLMIGSGIWMAVTGELLVGCATALFFGYLFYGKWKEFKNRKPQITINSNGIQTANSRFHDWEKIRYDRIYSESYHGWSTTYFSWHFPMGNEKVEIDDLTTNGVQLEHLLHVYRLRSEKRADSL